MFNMTGQVPISSWRGTLDDFTLSEEKLALLEPNPKGRHSLLGAPVTSQHVQSKCAACAKWTCMGVLGPGGLLLSGGGRSQTGRGVHRPGGSCGFREGFLEAERVQRHTYTSQPHDPSASRPQQMPSSCPLALPSSMDPPC